MTDGDRINWEEITREPATQDDSGVLEELHIIDRIARFHRDPDLPVSSSEPTGGQAGQARQTGPAGQAREPELASWGHLTIVHKIGEGTFAEVYRASDSMLQSDVALKLLKHGGMSNPSHALQEARRLARI